MVPHSSTLAWKIPWKGDPGMLQSMGLWRVGHDWVTSLSCIGEANGNPLQCSCLENPRDGGAWWAVVSGVAQSQTRMKRLSSSSSRFSSIPEWSFPHFLQFKSEFGNKRFMVCAAISSQSWFWSLYRASPSLAAKNIINLISVLTI